MDELKKRLTSGLRKFLVFEKAARRERHFELYRQLLVRAIRGEKLCLRGGDAVAAERLAAAGFLVRRCNFKMSGSGGGAFAQRYFEFPSVPTGADAGAIDLRSDAWLLRRFNAAEVLRFYSMSPQGLQWILEDLQHRMLLIRSESEPKSFQLAANINCLSRIWSILVFWGLTQIGEGALGDDDAELESFLAEKTAGMQGTGDSSSTVAARKKRYKERLGLAKLPDVFQVKRIKATSPYMRSKVEWGRQGA